jgi:hypothetical protein
MADVNERLIDQVELLAAIGEAGEVGLSYSDIAFLYLGTENPPRLVAGKTFKPALMTLKRSKMIVKGGVDGAHWVAVSQEAKNSRAATGRKKAGNELPVSTAGLVFQSMGPGKIASRLVAALHRINVETRPIRFANALAWIGQNETGPWTLLGEVNGSRILLDENAPDFRALPYSTLYIKVFQASKPGSDEGCYYLAKLPENWVAWVGSLE